MNSLIKKKKKLELMRVEASRFEMEIKIDKCLEEMERIKDNMVIQDARIEELKQELQGA